MQEINAKLYAFTWVFGIATAIMVASRYTSTLFDPYAGHLPGRRPGRGNTLPRLERPYNGLRTMNSQ